MVEEVMPEELGGGTAGAKKGKDDVPAFKVSAKMAELIKGKITTRCVFALSFSLSLCLCFCLCLNIVGL